MTSQWISLDTNVVIRFLLRDNEDQASRAEILIENQQVYITDVVLIEAIFVLEKSVGLSRDEIYTLISSFLQLPTVTYNTQILGPSMLLYKDSPALSIVDCYAATEAKIYQNNLVTFDKKLSTQGGNHVKLL